MAWIDDFLAWCRHQREMNLDQAERYESGRQRLIEGDVDISEEAANRHRRTVAEMSAFMARAARDRQA